MISTKWSGQNNRKHELYVWFQTLYSNKPSRSTWTSTDNSNAQAHYKSTNCRVSKWVYFERKDGQQDQKGAEHYYNPDHQTREWAADLGRCDNHITIEDTATQESQQEREYQSYPLYQCTDLTPDRPTETTNNVTPYVNIFRHNFRLADWPQRYRQGINTNSIRTTNIDQTESQIKHKSTTIFLIGPSKWKIYQRKELNSVKQCWPVGR